MEAYGDTFYHTNNVHQKSLLVSNFYFLAAIKKISQLYICNNLRNHNAPICTHKDMKKEDMLITTKGTGEASLRQGLNELIFLVSYRYLSTNSKAE